MYMNKKPWCDIAGKGTSTQVMAGMQADDFVAVCDSIEVRG
jgi:hypothetical protein